jgi:hypothetical protein
LRTIIKEKESLLIYPRPVDRVVGIAVTTSWMAESHDLINLTIKYYDLVSYRSPDIIRVTKSWRKSIPAYHNSYLKNIAN